MPRDGTSLRETLAGLSIGMTVNNSSSSSNNNDKNDASVMSAVMDKRQTRSPPPYPETDTRDASTPAAGPQEADGEGPGCYLLRALPHWRLLLTIAACTMTEVTLGITYTSANMTPYLTSYMRNSTGDPSLDYGRMLWVGNSGWLTFSVATPLLGLLERRMSRRIYFLIGVAFNATSFFGTYWAIQTSFVAMAIFHGTIQGVAQAILFPVCVNIAMQMFPQRRGLVGGITMAGYGGGAFIWNQVVTMWINPDNLQADQAVGDYVYFTQPELLDNVPTCFLVLGGLLTSAQLLSFFCIQFPTREPPPVQASDQEMEALNGGLAKEPSESPALGNAASKERDAHRDAIRAKRGIDENSEEKDTENLPMLKDIENLPMLKETSNQQTPDYEPLQILKSRVLWTFWLHNMTCDFAVIVIISFYKAYGQTFIRNDHLLAIVASCGSVFNAACRPVWGSLADWIGFFPAIILAQSILVATSATFVLTELADSSAMFFVWVCAMFVAISGIYAFQPAIMMAMFGPKYFVFSLGAIMTTGIMSGFLSVPLAEALMDAFSWTGLFIFVSAISLFGLLCLITLLVDCGHPLPGHMVQGLVGLQVTRVTHV